MNTDNETFDTTSTDSIEENKYLEGPIPSTSKTSNDTSQRHKKHCSSCNLHEDAGLIKNLLPNIDYSLIYKTLFNNQLTNDRIKHTLCDLLYHMERPSSSSLQLNKRETCCSCIPCNIHPIKIRKISMNDEIEINTMEANQLDRSNDVNMCKNDLEKLMPSENNSTNKELQSTIKLATRPIKKEIDEIQSFTAISTPNISVPNIAISSIAAPNTDHQEILLNEEANKIYNELISMFPNVDKFYIKQQCQQINLTDGTMLYELLDRLVEFLLENGQKYSTIKKVDLLEANKSTITYDLNNHYADLLRIFPEADPTYLRRIVEENYKHPEKIQKFIQSKLRNPNYPTRAQYLAQKITEQQKNYTTNFNIQQFLQLFPDPISHFENANRKCKFNVFAVDFLMHYFSKIKVNTILNTYSEQQYNLSLTIKVLETLSPDMKSKRLHNMMLPHDISLLQECAFIKHKVELKKYLTESLKNKEEFEKLKARNELVICQCCFDEYMPLKCFMCENGHLFCNKCIAKYAELILTEGKAHINCLLNCGSEYPLSVLQQVLSATNMKILFYKRQAEIMVGVDNLISCPFCHFPSISSPKDKVLRCFNCMKNFHSYSLQHLYVEERTEPKIKSPFEDGSGQ